MGDLLHIEFRAHGLLAFEQNFVEIFALAPDIAHVDKKEGLSVELTGEIEEEGDAEGVGVWDRNDGDISVDIQVQ